MGSYGRSKAPLALMEQIIMILVFALASVVCLQAFVYSDNLSKSDAKREIAVARAQTVAEYCKANQGDLDKAGALLQGEVTAEGLVVEYAGDGMVVRLRLAGGDGFLQRAMVTVHSDDGEEIYSMEIAYQRRERA